MSICNNFSLRTWMRQNLPSTWMARDIFVRIFAFKTLTWKRWSFKSHKRAIIANVTYNQFVHWHFLIFWILALFFSLVLKIRDTSTSITWSGRFQGGQGRSGAARLSRRERLVSDRLESTGPLRTALLETRLKSGPTLGTRSNLE